MLDITGNGALDVLIGLAFFYFLLSVICSAVNEGISTVMNYRAKDLEKGIAALIGSEHVDRFYGNPRVQALAKGARAREGIPMLKHLFTNSLPSYIPPRVFALTLLDLFAPVLTAPAAAPGKPAGRHAAVQHSDLVTRATRALATFDAPAATRADVAQPQNGPAVTERVATLLQDALDEAQADSLKLRSALENSFNEIMDRVSGWYKRRVQLILFVIALVVVGAANADSYRVGKTLWQNDAVRTAVVQEAGKVVGSGTSVPTCARSGSAADKVANCVAAVQKLGLPLGWSSASSPTSWGDGLGKVGGLLVTAFAILLGAPFWFDTLSKLAQLRGAGKSPDDKSSSARTGS